MLKDPALRALRHEPELGHDVHLVGGEQRAMRTLPLDLVATAFHYAVTDPTEVTVAMRRYCQVHRNAIAEQPVEGHFGVIFGEQVELELKELGDALVA